MATQVADVIVVGAGNAAFCAALAAQEQGAKVLMLEAAPEEESGGNSRFTAGSIRVVYNDVEDIKTLVPDLTPAEIETTDFGTYTADQFFDDMARVTQHHADPDLVELLVTKSFDSLNWMRSKGVRLIPIYGRQAFKICCSTAIASKAFARASAAKSASCAPDRSCLLAAASKPIRNGARAISGPVGISRRCAVPVTTPATAFAWRLISAPRRAATGQAVMPCSGK